MSDEAPIGDCAPSTSSLPFNAYHIHLPLYIMDMVRVFQDHPSYVDGIQEATIIEMLKKEPFACGDLEAQVKTALMYLTAKGFVRYIGNGYRTLGPFAKLSNSRSARHFKQTWQRIAAFQMLHGGSPEASTSSTGNCPQRGSSC
ncbi:uncharacterized protein LOC108160949 [Drosophila miranda]|uniref:uncharacterized protein LOC108160949 n=1 Tax=Drosophila miranda TaxID=7229 RepID=UPI0007E7B267|nr:uncharacterized protein LOC108160949 [Drosophila miranda]